MKTKNLKAFSILTTCIVFAIIALSLTLASCDTGAGRLPGYVVVFDYGEGGGNPPSRITVPPDAYTTLPDQGSMTPPVGKVLSGWKDPNNQYTYNPRTDYKVIREVRLTAQWRNSNSAVYTVSFGLGEGNGVAPAPIGNAVPGNVITLPDQGNMIAPAGKVFDGWLVNGAPYPARALYQVTGTNITIVAQWRDTGSGPTVNPPVSTLPGAPSGVTAAITSGTHIRISWSAVSGADYYKVYCIHNVYENDILINGATSTSTSYDWVGDEGWIYNFWVTAVNSAGEGPASSRVMLTMPSH